MLWIWLILAGLASGIVGGMGMGGGTILIPILLLLFDIKQINAQWINLVSFVVMCIIVLFVHKKNGLIKFKEIKTTLITGTVSAIIFSIIANFLKAAMLRKMFGVFLVAVSIYGIINCLKKKQNA